MTRIRIGLYGLLVETTNAQAPHPDYFIIYNHKYSFIINIFININIYIIDLYIYI